MAPSTSGIGKYIEEGFFRSHRWRTSHVFFAFEDDGGIVLFFPKSSMAHLLRPLPLETTGGFEPQIVLCFEIPARHNVTAITITGGLMIYLVIRTHDGLKNPYILIFLHTIVGGDYRVSP